MPAITSASINAFYLFDNRESGVSVEAVLLDEGERPEWDVPTRFGAQVFPRRAVAQLAQRMTAQVPR